MGEGPRVEIYLRSYVVIFFPRDTCLFFFKSETKLPKQFTKHISHVDYSCGAFKINCAVKELPNFTAMPNTSDGQPGPQHRGTVHFENHISEIDQAAAEVWLL